MATPEREAMDRAHRRGESTLDVQNLAREAASGALDEASEVEPAGKESAAASPGTRLEDNDVRRERLERERQEAEQEAQEAREAREAPEQEPEEPAREEPEFESEAQREAAEQAAEEAGIELADITQEDLEVLEEMGVQVPVQPDEVPEGFEDAYSQLLQTVISTEERAQQREMQAREAMLRVNDFAEQIEQNPNKVFLSMAIANEENAQAFQEAADEFRKMQEDPEYAEQVRREIEAEARMRAAERKEAALQQQELRRKANRVKRYTRRKAQQAGVSPERAEKFVAKQVKVNRAEHGEPDVSQEEIDAIVSDLAGPGRSRRTRKRTKTKKTAEREKESPTEPVEGRGKPSQETPEEEPPQTGVGKNRPLRQAVAKAAQRVRSQGV